MITHLLVTKADGEREIFDEAKLRASLTRSGAVPADVESVVGEIAPSLYDGITTEALYKKAFMALRKRRRPAAARYSLKRAILRYGPSGFPFESFIAEIFRARGYEVQTGIMVEGACATHELDMLAKRGDEVIAAEIKFHNSLSMKTDLKVALYVHARMQDLQKRKVGSDLPHITSGFLITNTTFTQNVMSYGECVGLRMVSWNYPHPGNLNDLIDEAGVHPITALTTLSRQEKLALLENKLVLCKDVSAKADQLLRLGIKPKRVEEVVEESRLLCGVN